MTTYSINLGITDYKEIYDLQRSIALKKENGELLDNFVFFLEHKSVFTLGKRGGKENLTVTDDFLEEKGVSVVHVERGGNITYHGEGQIIVYPVIDLKQFGFSVKDYVSKLEDIMISTSRDFGVDINRNELNRGTWVGNKKIGSVGIAVKKGIVFHGLSLNVRPDLTPFKWINPCGLEGVGITSLEHELGVEINIDNAYDRIIENTKEIFEVNFKPMTKENLLTKVM
ncbi:MAG: lipoyl(octanoyl) transferase LipB [Desulfobacterales bacterium]|nr:lipoyl(octanoyl) transferase LipB [Desulfobacterales bacterium]MCP4162728.1 lipoyl(octanoyl) transferase LipB [Deltaproteobacteria bacterium]